MPQAYPTNKNKQKTKLKQQRSNKKETKTTIIPSLKQRENVNSNRAQVGSDLGFHGLVLWGLFHCIVESGEVLNADRAPWVVCFVGCATGGTLERGVDTSTPGAAGGDGAEVVTCGVLMGAHSTGWFVCFA
jgi:hypothetical protein